MPKDVQTSLRMPEELRDRLAQAAASAGRGLGAEICRRLEASFGSVPPVADRKTGDLLRVVARCAAIIDKEWAAWHSDAGAFDCFKAATDGVLLRHKPEGQPAAAPRTDRGRALFGGAPERTGSNLAFLAELAEDLA